MATRMQQRRGTAAQWISTNAGDGPILNPGEIGYETDTNKFKVGDGINHWVDLNYFLDAVALGGSIDDYVPLTQKDAALGVPSLDASKNLIVAGASIIIEGATDNTFETTLTVTDPTSDRTITLPNATGTVVLADGSGNVTVSGDLTVSGTTTTVNSTILEVQNEIKFEGTTANDFETSLKVTDPTADRIITFPDATGTVVLADNTQTITNKTLTSPKINEDVAVTATATELNVLDGITASTAELNVLDGIITSTAQLNVLNGITATTAELNILAGAALSTAELNYVDGVTSAIQTQLNNKQAIVTDVSDTEIGYLNGVTSAIQTQLNGKQATVANVSDVEIEYLNGVTSAIQTQLDDKSTASKTETLTNKTLTSPVINTPTGITKSDVGLANVDNTTDASKPVSTAAQTALDLKANLADPTFTGTVNAADLTLSGNLTINGTTTTINSTTLAVDDKNIVIGDVVTPTDTTADGGGITLKGATDKTFNWVDATDSWTSSEHINLASGKDLKVNGTAVISSTAGGFIFTDGTQTLEGVPSRTPIIQKTDSYTLSALTERDSLIEVAKASATTITIPLNSAVAYPVGTSIDILQTSTGQVTIAGDAGVTVNSTPGLKLRTQWSTATLFKRATNTWVVYGDLTA